MTLDLTGDELAGIVDLFGALSRDELETALSELAFKHGDTAAMSTIDESLESYHLVEFDGCLLVGPRAFPSIPESATDLPHIMDVDQREIDRQQLSRSVEKRFRAEAARALDAGDEARVVQLLDVSYDLEAWGPLDLGGVRERLETVDKQ